jgi:hypothetical protein
VVFLIAVVLCFSAFVATSLFLTWNVYLVILLRCYMLYVSLIGFVIGVASSMYRCSVTKPQSNFMAINLVEMDAGKIDRS